MSPKSFSLVPAKELIIYSVTVVLFRKIVLKIKRYLSFDIDTISISNQLASVIDDLLIFVIHDIIYKSYHSSES